MNPGAIVTRLFLLVFCLSAQVAAFQFTSSQTPPTSPEAARIDQLINECRALLGKGAFEEVGQKAKEALTLSRKLEDKVRQSRSLNYVALSSFHGGRIEEAIEPFKQAATLAGEAGDQRLQLLALNSAAVLLRTVGKYEEAFFFNQQSLALCRARQDRVGEASQLREMGNLFTQIGDYPQAESYLQQAFALARELKSPRLEHSILNSLGAVSGALSKYADAVAWCERAKALENVVTDNPSRFQTVNNLALIHYAAGELDRSAAAWEETLKLAQIMKVPLAESAVLNNLSLIYALSGKAELALDYSTRSLTMLRQTDRSPSSEAKYLYPRALANRALGLENEALNNLRESLALLERARLFSLPTETARAQLHTTNQHIFLEAIDLLTQLGRHEEALEIAETWHARAFLDLLTESRIDLRNALSAEQKATEEKILTDIARVQKELWQPKLSSDREVVLREELKKAEARLEGFQLELHRTTPQYASVKYPQPIKAAQITKGLLLADTALIEYVLHEKKSFAWVIYNGKVSAVMLPPWKELSPLLSEYRTETNAKITSLTAATAATKLNAISHQLYQKLLQPLEPHLMGAKKLIVAPDGPLVYLPFETLVSQATATKATYLLERFAISYTPSATALLALKNSPTSAARASTGLLAFGDPIYKAEPTSEKNTSPAPTLNATRMFDLRNLPYTRREVSEIAALFPRTEQQTFLGAEAREQNVKTASLDKYRYVHFAAHGVVDEEHPARSGIALSAEANSQDDGVLQMSEVLRLKLNADLVTLSACRTGLGKLLHGEGMIGLTRAFLYAGADSVVVSLWNVNDVATASLMKDFYKRLRQGLAKDEALRQAKLTLLKGKQRAWQHPYFWAAFVLVGEQQ